MGRAEPRAAWIMAAALALLAPAPGAVAQDPPEPIFELKPDPGAVTWTVDVRIPPGWGLYGAEAGPVGLPLTGRWIGPGVDAHPASLWGPAPETVDYPWGTARVHRGRVRLSVSLPPAAADTLELRWALCRPELCVPGETRVAGSRTVRLDRPGRGGVLVALPKEIFRCRSSGAPTCGRPGRTGISVDFNR